MKIPSLALANEFLEEGYKKNPGLWVEHSRNTAKAAEVIARCDQSLDPDAAYILGLLHDIGRRAGFSYCRHTIDGYNFLIEKGFDDAARICMTHNHNANGRWDCTAKEYEFVCDYFYNIQFNDYDLLIQLCDSLALPSGFCLIEQRLVDAAIRNESFILSIVENMIYVWKTLFNIKMHFEKKIGCSIYTLLPGVIENTFDMSSEDIYRYFKL